MVKAYLKYKNSYVPWIGEVPEHWDVLALARLLKERKEKNCPIKTDNILSLSMTRGVILYADKDPGGNKSKEDLSAYMLAYPGDIVLNSMNVVVGSVGLSKYFGAVSPVYYMLRPRNSNDLVEYFDAIFHNVVFQRSLFGLGNGIMYIESKSTGKLNTIRLRIPMSRLKRVSLPYPSREEQIAITNFLDYADKRIRRYISAKQKVVKLLNEQKQAVIYEALTRGIDASVRLKPSGVEWIGDIPEHWELKKIKRIVNFAPSRAECSFTKNSNEKVVFLPMEKVSCDGQIDCSERRSISEVWQGYTYFRKDDVVIAKITPCFENGKGACLDELQSDFGFGTSEFIVLRAKKEEISPDYLYRITTTRIFRLLGAEAMTGAAGQQRVSSSFVKNYLVALPPKDEQLAINKYIDEQTLKFELMIKQLKASINFVQEYRSRLISDVVTGKIDVRDVKLPEVLEIDEQASVDEQEIPEEIEDTEEVVNADE
ncbi:MAG: restriction endonuclease subunit S [Candidatus Omnitrophica bacterium]|nr:restriction endonuclease subunit S [Candidatus Omnitrophota bacterium]